MTHGYIYDCKFEPVFMMFHDAFSYLKTPKNFKPLNWKLSLLGFETQNMASCM